jgi:hypothetical protein
MADASFIKERSMNTKVKPSEPTISECRAYFGTRWKKFTGAVDDGAPLNVLGAILHRRSIAEYCRGAYLRQRRRQDDK